MTQSCIRVAIIGGGLAGTILMNALLKYHHLDVRLYEAQPQLQERGASVGLSVNAQRALQLIGLDDVLKKAEAVTEGCLQFIVGEGPDAGKLIDEVDFGKQTVHRAALLKQLIAPIPLDRIHLNKRMSSVNGNKVVFKDGTSAVADVIIGADGIHSGVRKFVLGESHPAISPVPCGFWDARAIVSREEALAELGPSCINTADPHQHIHIGSKGILLHDIIDEGRRVAVIISGPITSEWDTSAWTHTVSRTWCDELYKGWGEFGLNLLDLLFGDKDEISAFIQWESAEAPTLYNSTICMMGDAGHATSPWQGSGLSQAIEDALILERLLGRCQTLHEVPLAFEVYDRIRRPRAQHIVRSSRRAAESYFSAFPGGAEQLRRDIPSRDYILNWDTAGAVKEAVQSFEHLKTAVAGRWPDDVVLWC